MLFRLFRSGLSALIFLLFAVTASAQHYMMTRPGRPPAVVRRPPPPYRNAVWIDEEWKWNNGRYVWSGGYWMRPPYVGGIWRPGRWVRGPRGWQWMPGHWARPRRH